MPTGAQSFPPTNPDLKRELKDQLLNMSPRAFELFAGEFLIYAGLERISVTTYQGDGGIDAEGDLIATLFRIPVGVQVKRYKKGNVPRSDIDNFIGALSGRFSQGIFMTTANYRPNALQKATTSIPRIMTLNGDQIVSVMLRHSLGLKLSPINTQNLGIDTDYFATFEAQKQLLTRKIHESSQCYDPLASTTQSDESLEGQEIEVKPENDLISINALGYALRVDPNRVRRWLDSGKLLADDQQKLAGRTTYYFRRDRIEHIRKSLSLGTNPTSSDEWKQEFLDYARSHSLVRSYKPVMMKAIFKLADREGKVRMEDLIKEFREFYIQRVNAGLPAEIRSSILREPDKVSDNDIKQRIVDMPLDRYLIKNYIEYFPDDETLRIVPQLWQNLRYYEILDILESFDDQIKYYYTRDNKKGK